MKRQSKKQAGFSKKHKQQILKVRLLFKIAGEFLGRYRRDN
jgi:hypothetical protein